MKLSQIFVDFILSAEGKALATIGSQTGVHVVPVSSVKIVGDEIILVNYFFGQTLRNITENPEVALACWKGLEGYQIKAQARHETEGELFDEVVVWIQDTIPGRVVKGVLILTPTKMFNVSAGANAGQEITN